MTWKKPGDDLNMHQDGWATIVCPMPECEWVEYEPQYDLPVDTLASVFGMGTMRLTAEQQFQQNASAKFHAHAETHSVCSVMTELQKAQGRGDEMFRLLRDFESGEEPQMNRAEIATQAWAAWRRFDDE